MTILVIEDEPEAREGLCRLLNRASPDWQVLEPCRNGLEGLAAARLHDPDLIVTDIRMADMDGLEMIAHLKADPRPPTVVVLSGYPEFDYARRCLALGVRDYLLKPVAADQLLDTLRGLERELFSSRALGRRLETSGEPDGRPGMLVLCRFAGSLGVEKRTFLKREVRNLFGPSLGVEAWETTGECWFWVEGGGTPSGLLAAPFLRHLESRMGTVAVCARPATRGTTALAAEGLRTDVRRFLMTPERVFSVTDPTTAGTGLAPDYRFSLESDLGQALRNPDARPLADLLDGFFVDTFREGFDPAGAVRLGQRVLFSIQTHLKDLDPVRFRALLEANPAGRLEAALTWDEARELFAEVARIAATASPAAEVPSDKPKIQAALAIVADRMPTPPSLGALADELHLSPEYLSRLFKQEVGLGYSRYVVGLRMAQARTLLADRSLTIHQVSERLGFQNSKYFFEVFRKETGQSPSEYRSPFL